MTTTVAGVKAKHAIITDTCRTNRGSSGALQEAIDRLADEYHCCAEGWPVGKGAKFHLVLIVERPGSDPPVAGQSGSPHQAFKTTDTGDPILYAPDGYCFGAIHLRDVRLKEFCDWFAAWSRDSQAVTA